MTLVTDRVHGDELVTSRAIGWGHFKPSRWGQIKLTNPAIATTSALVTMKAHALPRRKTTEKRANDAYDLVRLVEAAGPALIARRLAQARPELKTATAEALRYYFSVHGDSTAKRIRTNRAQPDAATMTELRVREVARVADALEALRPGEAPPRPGPT